MLQAVDVYLKDEQTLAELRQKYRELNWVIQSVLRTAQKSQFWVAEWAGVPLNYVDETLIVVTEDRIDIYFGAPNGTAIDPERHLHAHYIFDRQCNLQMRRERNTIRKSINRQ